MDKFDYSRSKDTAYRLINRFGQELTFTRQVGETYDPSTGTVSTTTESYSADAVWLNYKNDEIDESIVLQGDARVLIAANVQVDDRVTFEGDEWRVVVARPLNPAGIELYTEAQVRN